MLGRLHHCLWVACLMLGVGTAHGQTLPNGAYGPYYGPATGPDDYVDPNIVSELLPPDRGMWWNVDMRLNQAIQDTSHGMWFRLEWMSTEVDAPGRTLLGANMSTVPNPREPFDVQLPNGVITTAAVLDTSSVNFDNINGIRGTWGVPLAFGHVETMVWGTENSTSRINTDLLPATDPFQDVRVIATSLLTNGAQGTSVVLYDLDFRAQYSTEIFSAESNLYYNYQAPRLGLRIMPLAGFRFVDYDEALVQKGSYDNSSGLNAGGILIDPIDRRIESVVDNDVYGLQTGLRTEFVHQFFTLGCEPKVALGYNHYEARVSTDNLRTSPYVPIVTDGLTESKETQNLLAPYFDWSMYAKIHLTQSFHLRVGWNFTWFSNISRADDNIYYNDNGLANPPAVRARAEEEALGVSNFTLGGEYLLP